MADTTYVDGSTIFTADSANDFNRLHYTILGDPADAAAVKTALFPAWTTPAYAAGDFTGSGTITWTVAAGDVTTYAYIINGKMMTVTWRLVTTSVAGTGNGLQIAIPASKVATKTTSNPCYVDDNGTTSIGLATVTASGTVITVNKIPVANYTQPTTNTTETWGSITFEIN